MCFKKWFISEMKTIRFRQHIYVQSRHRISLEKQTQRRRENAKMKRNDFEASSVDHQDDDLNTTSQRHNYQTDNELLRLRKDSFTKISRNSLKAKFSIKRWRLIFRSKLWRNSYVKQNIIVYTVSLFFWLFHYEWTVQILDIQDQIRDKGTIGTWYNNDDTQ